MNTTNTKSIVYIIIAILVVAGAIFAFTNHKREQQRIADLSINDIKKLNEEEQKRALEARVKELERQVTELSVDTDASGKYTAYISLAEARLELKNYSGAISALDSIPEEKKTNSRVLLAYGIAYKGTGENDKAKEHIDKSLSLDDTIPQPWLAKIELNADLPNDQIDAMYREAIAKTKSNVDVMVSYARFAEKIGNKDLAVAAWETAINVNSEKEAEYRAEIARLRPEQQ